MAYQSRFDDLLMSRLAAERMKLPIDSDGVTGREPLRDWSPMPGSLEGPRLRG